MLWYKRVPDNHRLVVRALTSNKVTKLLLPGIHPVPPSQVATELIFIGLQRMHLKVRGHTLDRQSVIVSTVVPFRLQPRKTKLTLRSQIYTLMADDPQALMSKWVRTVIGKILLQMDAQELSTKKGLEQLEKLFQERMKEQVEGTGFMLEAKPMISDLALEPKTEDLQNVMNITKGEDPMAVIAALAAANNGSGDNRDLMTLLMFLIARSQNNNNDKMFGRRASI